MSERWLDTWSYPGYQVSDLGRVRKVGGRLLSVTPVRGRAVVYMYRPRTHSKETPVATLVLRAFVGPKPGSGYHVLYRDGDRSNVRLSNLGWGRKSPSAGELQDVVRQRQALSAEFASGLARAISERMRSIRNLAQNSGVSRQTIMTAVRMDGAINVATLVQVAAGLGMRPSQLMARAEALMEPAAEAAE